MRIALQSSFIKISLLIASQLGGLKGSDQNRF